MNRLLFLTLAILTTAASGQSASFSVSAPTSRTVTSIALIRDPDDPLMFVEETNNTVPEAVADVSIGPITGKVTTRNELRASGSFVELTSFGLIEGPLSSGASFSVLDVDVTVDVDTQALLETENGTDLGGGSSAFFFGTASGDQSVVVNLQGGQTFTFGINHNYTIGAPFSAVDGFARLTVLRPTPAQVLPGDFNADGSVDVADYTVWRDTSGRNEALLAGAGDASGEVDPGDYQFWVVNFGATASSALAIPEPAAAMLMIVAGMATVLRR